MKEACSDLNERIAKRVRDLRAEKELSLDALSAKSGVSRSMISLIERGESSPTAVVLEKIAAGLGATLASLFDAASVSSATPGRPIARSEEQLLWQDPESGYVRRNVSPAGMLQPMRIVEVRFPAGARVAFESTARDSIVHQQVWILEGAMDITVGKTRHRLGKGDCLAMQLDGPTMFHNPTRKPTRYAVVISDDVSPHR